MAAVAVSRAAERWEATPRPAAQQPPIHIKFIYVLILIGFSSCPVAPIVWCRFVIIMPVIFAPFPYVAMHIMQSPRIAREAGYIRSLLPVFSFFAIPVQFTPIVICQLRADRGAEMKRLSGARAAGVFPLGLAG